MNRLKFLLATLVVAVVSLGIYSCAKDGASQEEQSNLNVEVRSRCGDNFNVAPTPTLVSAVLHNGQCCYVFAFTGIANMGYTAYGSYNGFYTQSYDEILYPTVCSGIMFGGSMSCCVEKDLKTLNIVFENGSCVSISLPGCS